jgi:hypothetical protein
VYSEGNVETLSPAGYPAAASSPVCDSSSNFQFNAAGTGARSSRLTGLLHAAHGQHGRPMIAACI